MSIANPQISKELLQIDDFSSYVHDFLLDETPIFAIKSYNEQIEDMDFFKIETRTSVFEKCTFYNCNFETQALLMLYLNHVIYQTVYLQVPILNDVYLQIVSALV